MLSFCNPAFPYRVLDKVEVFQQVGLDREGAVQEDRSASASGIQMEGWVQTVAAVLVVHPS